MEIPKDAIISFLRERGQSDQVAQAEQELPDQVDSERDSDLLGRFGVDPQELMQHIPGGLGDKLPDF